MTRNRRVAVHANDENLPPLDRRNVRSPRAPPKKRNNTDVRSLASKLPSPVPDYNTSDDDESEDEYGVRPSHKSRKKRRRVTTANGTPPAEVRFSTRRAGKVTNYNEDDEDDFEEEDITPTYDYQEPEPDVGGIDLVLDHRPREGVGMFCCQISIVLFLTIVRYLEARCETCRS